MLEARRCDRVILSAAVDIMQYIDPSDHGTVGLFGSGAGAVVLERSAGADTHASIRGVHWETHTGYSGLGQVPILGYERHPDRLSISAGYYQMDGRGLTRAALLVLPAVLDRVLDTAGWTREAADLVITHQPNAKLLEIGIRHLGLDAARVPTPVRHLGNMGPASLLVNLSLARESGHLTPGTNLLLIAFGLGFSCGVAALTL
jgi:3-oxoacyl-[acyl-carrier-protein] synthase-3